MNQRITGVRSAAVLVAVIGLSGCGVLFGPEGVFPSRAMDYKKASEASPLTLPAGKTSGKRVELYPVPAAREVPKAFDPRDSDDIPKPSGLLSVNVDAGVEVRSTGDQRWLLIHRDRDAVFALVRNFVVSNGFNIEHQDADAGVVETGWLRPRESERPGVFKRIFTLNFRDAYDRFRFRLEPAGNGVIVRLDQRHEDVFSSDSLPASVDWSAESSEQSLTELLANDLSDFIAEEQVNHLRTGVLASAYANAPRTIMTWDGNGFPVLVVTLDMNRAWISVGNALRKAGIEVKDLNRSLGVYYFERKHAERSEEEKKKDKNSALDSDQYQLKLLRSDEGVHIAVQLDDNTLAPIDEAQAVIERFRSYVE